MSKGKWGESFLKSGLPLEHLTQVTFQALGWYCEPNIEVERPNREGSSTWFEIDMEANAPGDNRDTGLSFLVECKYHDLSRFWFFLPREPGGRWHFDDRVLSCGPVQTLTEPRATGMLSLAPLSSGGVVVSEDGTKQDNAAHTAIQQLVNGYVPRVLGSLFRYNLDFYNSYDSEEDFLPSADALVPMIVTNAALYRLKPSVSDLSLIRDANAPPDVADEVEWTWCYHDSAMALFEQNLDAIEKHKSETAELIYRFPSVEQRLDSFADRPNWIAVVNSKHLAKAVQAISAHFAGVKTRSVASVLGRQKPRRKPKGAPRKKRVSPEKK